MKAYVRLAAFLILIPGCAAYKELEPDPEVSALERGYIELKDGDDHFELERDNKYFVTFPSPYSDNSYLVLVTSAKPAIRSFLTASFDEGKGAMMPISDEAASSDSVMVYATDKTAAVYHWVIDSVRNDLVLTLNYRYVPKWRYTFENKYAEFQDVLERNTVDRSTYNSIDINFDTDRLDVAREMSHVEDRSGRITSMNDELLRLESIFPPGIATSRDTAYERYVAFKARVDDELSFQKDYSSVLNLFKKEKETRGNTSLFLEAVPFFSEIMSQAHRFPGGVRAKTSRILVDRLTDVAPALDRMLRSKDDILPITPAVTAEAVGSLYRSCGEQMPAETESILRFISRFNTEVEQLQASNGRFDALRRYFDEHATAATESFFADLMGRVAEIESAVPDPRTARFERFGTYRCAVRLNREITNARNRAGDLQTMYQTAGAIAGYIGSAQWISAESRLRELHSMRGTSDAPEIPSQRSTVVKLLESNMFSAVRRASEQRIDAFIRAHEMAIDNVTALYADSAFLPVHQITFSSVGPSDLEQKRKQIEGYLDQIKYVQFPENSIKSIYADFTRNMKDRGVEKARAIVEHGKFYKGTDKQVKGLITECDVEAAKWIVKPKDFRKLFALPVTSNRQGTNEYMFRIRLQIPSEAQFPVFDVTLKLPQEVAEKSRQEQWFESITIDKKPIRQEGRFRITSPTAENNYESLITPVQMDKEGRNILEVRFKYPGFRVFEVSAMAQVPIIRKN